MIKWLSTLPIFKDVYKQGGIDSFALAHKDIRDTMSDDLDKRATDIMEDKLADMMSPVDWRYVLNSDVKRGIIFIGSERADDKQLLNLKSEAEMLKASNLWNLLHETPNALAQEAMFKTGADTDAFLKGRSMIYHLDSQKKIIETLISYKPKP